MASDKSEKVPGKNGGRRKGSGRKKGVPNKMTIERAAAQEAYRQLVLQRLTPIFEHQYALVRGISYLYRIDENKHGGKEHVIVTDPDEIGDILAQMHEEGTEGVYNDKFYYITVRPPENGAIKDMLDRALGKAAQPLTGTDDGPIKVVIEKYAGDTPSA